MDCIVEWEVTKDEEKRSVPRQVQSSSSGITSDEGLKHPDFRSTIPDDIDCEPKISHRYLSE